MEDDDSNSEGLGFTYEDVVEMDLRYREAHTFIIECDSTTFGPTHDKPEDYACRACFLAIESGTGVDYCPEHGDPKTGTKGKLADGTHFGSGAGGPVVWAGPPGPRPVLEQVQELARSCGWDCKVTLMEWLTGALRDATTRDPVAELVDSPRTRAEAH